MTRLPEPWFGMYERRKTAILERLQDFASVKQERYFYELAYCILTPQSSAKHAALTIAELERDRFFEVGFDPTTYLRDPKHYIRFHNVKAKRLLHARENFGLLESKLQQRPDSSQELRALVLQSVPGLGMKEASHFLRNIGVRGLAILDRHIYKHLTRLEVIPEPPKTGPTVKRYLAMEAAWLEFSLGVGISLDELDLLFWSMETGEILK